MKRLFTLFFSVCCVLSTAWANDFAGKVVTQSKASEIKADTWYSLYNTAGKRFLYENGKGALTVTNTPALNFASDVQGALIRFVANGNEWHLQTISGNYVGELGGSTIATTATPDASYTIEKTDAGFTLKNGEKYLSATVTDITASAKADAWTLYEVSLKTQDQLTASQRTSFVNKFLKSTDGALVRLSNKRTATSYLTATEGDKVAGAKSQGATALSQIWLVHPNGDSHTIRNAETGKFLHTSFRTQSGDNSVLYIQSSPNNGTNDAYYVVSNKADFSGNSCLNLNGDGVSLFEWSYAGDPGSDWQIYVVSEVSIDDVRDHIMQNDPYAKELKENTYYRIVNENYSQYLSDAGGYMNCRDLDEKLYTQYWTLKKSGDGWNIRNVLTDNYIHPQTATSTPFPTKATTATMYITNIGDEWKNAWYITSSRGNASGMHCDASRNVVLWTNNNASNTWLFEEVELSEEEIAAAKAGKKAYEDMVANLGTIQGHLDNLFADKACTTLKSEIAGLSDEALAENADFKALPADIQSMTLKVKNNTWGLKSETATEAVADGNYEKFFRVSEYMPYSNHEEMAWEIGQSNSYGKLSNPTGIYLPQGKVAYIYLEEDAPAGTTLQVEAVGVFPENCEAARTGQTTDLHKGLNLIFYSEDKMLFIFYEVQDISRKVTDFANAKIHIEGGVVHGTFDITRGMKNQDWTNMVALGLIENLGIIHLKSDNIVMLMKREETLEALSAARRSYGTSYTDVELLMHVWNTIVANEEYYQGLDAYGERYRNIWNAFSMNHDYMYATTYGSYFENSTLRTVLNYHIMTHSAGNLWGPSHEFGHNHQAVINCIGNTEVSNNLFSNINVWEAGISSTRGRTPKDNFEDLGNGRHWLDRNIWIRTKMYFQLYLYFHEMGIDKQFYQKLFTELRKDRMTSTNQWKTVTVDGEEKSGKVYYGKDDYLKFAKKCCDIAQMDLSEFFESYGFFVPVEDYYGDDYGAFVLTTTQREINDAKRYMQKYPKKAGNIMFINDYVKTHPANKDNKFKAVPAANGMKVAYSNEEPFGSVTSGDYTEYDGRSEYVVTGDYYTISGSTISFKGKDYLGHKVYDLEGNLIWASANKSGTIPAKIKSKFPNEVVVVAVEPNMNDVPCHYYKSGSSPIYKMSVTFSDSVTNTWYANKNFDQYMPANAIAIITDAKEANAEVLGTKNVANQEGVAQSVVIDGNLPIVIPQDITVQNLTFSKDGEGFQALKLPFDVPNAVTVEGTEKVEKALVKAGSPVIMEGKINFELPDVTLSAGTIKGSESGFVLAADGNSTIAGEGQISPFTYVFDGAYTLTTATAINDILSAPNAGEHKVYDMSGRRVNSVKQPGLYIVNGKKMMVK